MDAGSLQDAIQQFWTDIGPSRIMNRYVGDLSIDRLECILHTLPSLGLATRDDSRSMETELWAEAVGEAFNVIGRCCDNDGVRLLPFYEGFDRTKELLMELGATLVALSC